MDRYRYREEVNTYLIESNNMRYLCKTEAEALKLLWDVTKDERAIKEDPALTLQSFETLFEDYKNRKELKR